MDNKEFLALFSEEGKEKKEKERVQHVRLSSPSFPGEALKLTFLDGPLTGKVTRIHSYEVCDH